MMRAYPECYLSSARQHLACAFDFAASELGIDGTRFSGMLARSEVGRGFEQGLPWALAGKSGAELALAAVSEMLGGSFSPDSEAEGLARPGKGMRLDEGESPDQGRSVPYWVGWSVAFYQWSTARTFADIFAACPFQRMAAMYPIYHEQDVTAFARDLEGMRVDAPTNLRRLREASGLSQSQLARQAQVGLRSIQMYEQRNNDIDKAQAATLLRIARVLGCRVEDLLEDPLQCRCEYELVRL